MAFYETLHGLNYSTVYFQDQILLFHVMITSRLLDQIERGDRKLEADFSIDPAFELAQLIYGDKTNPGPLLTADPSFCVVSADNCATYPRQFDICVSDSSNSLMVFMDTAVRF